MFFALGFLTAGLLAIVLVPSLWKRAERLTKRRIESTTPVRMADIQADKDQLRAEFAMTARKLEMSVEALKQKAAQRLVEIGRKEEVVDRLRTELATQREAGADMSGRIEQLQSTVASLEKQLRDAGSKVTDRDRQVADTRDRFDDVNGQLEQMAATADSRKVEIVALKTRIQNNQDKIADLERLLAKRDGELAAAETRAKEAEAATRSRDADVERLQREMRKLGEQIDKHEPQMIKRRDEIVDLKREVAAAQADARDKTAALASAEALVRELRDAGKKAEGEQRQLTERVTRRDAEVETLKSRLGETESELKTRQEEASREKRETDDDWQQERMESALLRERLNDLAAEVGRLAATLDESGEINAMIDAAVVESAPKAVKNGKNGKERTPGSLAERIRALQSQVSRH